MFTVAFKKHTSCITCSVRRKKERLWREKKERKSVVVLEFKSDLNSIESSQSTSKTTKQASQQDTIDMKMVEDNWQQCLVEEQLMNE